MQTEKIRLLEEQINSAKLEVLELGAMRPGHLSAQHRTSDKARAAYPQLSYTFKKKGYTDYVRAVDLERIKREVENYKTFKEIIERICGLSIKLSRAKNQKSRRKTDS